eukprot:14942.XXX_60694_60837_1 [CDS] Oithona nana genome sequencing.
MGRVLCQAKYLEGKVRRISFRFLENIHKIIKFLFKIKLCIILKKKLT